MTNGTNGLRTTVLVVEDEALLRLDIADYLRDAGLDVIEAMDADEAVRLLESRRDIHVVFTDVHMPGSMDGIRLVAYVRNRWPPIKLIVASGHSIGADVTLPSDCRFFRKHYDSAQVAEAIAGLKLE